MKKLLLILPLLVACKSGEKANCEAYGDVHIKQDTITVTKHTNLKK
jgi:hypothetical protein